MDAPLGVDANYTLKHIASRLAEKCNHPYLRTCGYVKSRAVITLVRETHLCIWGYWLIAYDISVQKPQWEYIAGLHVFQ